MWACSWHKMQLSGMELARPFPGQLRILSSQMTRPVRKSLIRKPTCVSPACRPRPLRPVPSKTARHPGLWPKWGN